jgi:hypothetical protein
MSFSRRSRAVASFLRGLLVLPALAAPALGVTLTVTNGAGGGIYAPGAKVELLASPRADAVFDRWLGLSGLDDARATRATVSMPGTDAKVVATYRPSAGFTPATESINGTGVVWYVPQPHVGLIVLFHGAGGSAATLAAQNEIKSFERDVVAAGYGFAMLDSANRSTGTWSTAPTATNPDVANVTAVRAAFVSRGVLSASDPLFSLGLSAGTEFASNVAADLGLPAVAAYIGPDDSANLYAIPTFFGQALNGPLKAGEGTDRAIKTYNALAARGVPAALHLAVPGPVYGARLARIGGLSVTDGDAIVSALRAGGYLDANGLLLADPASSGWQKVLPSAYSAYQTAIEEELEAADARHRFYSDADDQLLTFFDARLPAVRTVPIVLDVLGRQGAHFTTELLLANRGTTAATAHLLYTAAASLGASGTGSMDQPLAAGQQLVVEDAIAFLRTGGVPIPLDSHDAGSLRVTFSGLSRPDAGWASARTTTPSGIGRAGLAYAGASPDAASSADVRLFGLRESAADRTNLALVNAGTGGDVTLRVTLTTRDANGVRNVALPDRTLAPGQWTQLDSVLSGAQMTNAFATVHRVSGTDPFLAYAVVNDNVTNDGSYAAAAPIAPAEALLVPVLVETPVFESELVLANPTSGATTATLAYQESLASGPHALVSVTETLLPGEQKIFPQAIDHLRSKGAAIGARGGSFAGTLSVTFSDSRAGFAGARTSAGSGGGLYGLSYPALAASRTAPYEAWVFGLRQDTSVRSNLAFANAGSDELVLRYDLYDAAGALVGSADPFTLEGSEWRQANSVLPAGVEAGYAHVVKVSGQTFLTYGIANDGGSLPGTNDGSYLEMSVPR